MKNMSILAATLAAAAMTAACTDEIEMRRPPVFTLPDLPEVEGVHTYKAPLYWSVYEYCYEQEQAGVANSDMDFVPGATDLKPYGYDMVCTDGFIPMLAKDASGYMTHYGSMSLKDLVAKCKARGLKVGVYDNPLWIHGPRDTAIGGTNYYFGSLYYNGTTEVMNPKADDRWFHW